MTGAGSMSALQKQVKELTGQVRDLKVQRVIMSTNWEIKLQCLWVEGELKDGAMAVQVEERMGVLEGGLASQAKHAEGSMSEIRFQARDSTPPLAVGHRKHI